ncbi:MAG: pyridoxamine 5'-phosphate oxidase family protein [Streptosporangiaceae bacterium]|jgi:hypothetical protein|nr:pyridoxamine 5'-phosphate oxidase family protein [Actinomycetota bacterium]
MTQPRGLAELTRDESLRLLGSVPFGRIVFSHRALPAIRPVNHLVAGDQVIIRASLGAPVSSAVDGAGAVVAYQADQIDSASRLGWSVVVVGRARKVGSEMLAAGYREALRPWIDGDMDEVISISADLVTGFRMIPGTTGAGCLASPGEELPTA